MKKIIIAVSTAMAIWSIQSASAALVMIPKVLVTTSTSSVTQADNFGGSVIYGTTNVDILTGGINNKTKHSLLVSFDQDVANISSASVNLVGPTGSFNVIFGASVYNNNHLTGSPTFGVHDTLGNAVNSVNLSVINATTLPVGIRWFNIADLTVPANFSGGQLNPDQLGETLVANWSITGTYVGGQQFEAVAKSTVTVIPEPTSLVMSLGAFASLTLLRKRR